MESQISSMLEDFEKGKLTRRQLVAHVTALAAAVAATGGLRSAQAQEPEGTFVGIGLNHIALDVTDVARSRDFYVKHLGLVVASSSENSCFLTCGDDFVALFRREKAGMHHYCYSVKDYDVALAEEKLKAEGLAPRRQGARIYFDDPDGLEVQLAADNHKP